MRWLIILWIMAVTVACGGSSSEHDADATATRSSEETTVAAIVGSDNREEPTPTRRPAPRPPTTAPTRQPVRVNVEYRITANIGTQVDITLTNSQGGIEQLTGQQTPWTRRLQVEPGTYVSVMAQSKSQLNVSLTCSITADGQDWKTSSSSGMFVIATCSGVAGVD